MEYFSQRTDYIRDEIFSVFGFVNFVTMCILVVICIAFPIFCLIFYLPRFDRWVDDDFEA